MACVKPQRQPVDRALPGWAYVLAGVLGIAGLTALLVFENALRTAGTWTVYTTMAMLYLVLQILVEGALSLFWESGRWPARLLAAAAIVGFYLYFLAD